MTLRMRKILITAKTAKTAKRYFIVLDDIEEMRKILMTGKVQG